MKSPQITYSSSQGYTNSQEAAYIRHAEKMKQQRQKALGEAPLEPTYEFNPRIKENMECSKVCRISQHRLPNRIPTLVSLGSK